MLLLVALVPSVIAAIARLGLLPCFPFVVPVWRWPLVLLRCSALRVLAAHVPGAARC